MLEVILEGIYTKGGSYIRGFWKLYWSNWKLYWREKEVILEGFGSYIGGLLRY